MQIILHIGQPKTASTSIQIYCAENRNFLSEKGILYPNSMGTKKQLLSELAKNPSERRYIPQNDDIFGNINAEFRSNCDVALLSDEVLFYRSAYKIKKIKKIFDKYADRWRIICYLRKPEDHIVSYYQQFVRNRKGDTYSFNVYFYQMMCSTYYRYAMQMRRWERLFGEGSVEVRVFHRDALQGSPIEDFMQWIGIDPQTLPPNEREPANVSLDRAGIEIFRFLHTCRSKHPDFIQGHDLEQVRRKVQALATNDLLRIDPDRAKLLHEQFREDHERLAKRYLSPEHAAVLLAPPAETPLQPSVAPEALFERMMAIFNNPDFAHLAVEEIGDRTRKENREEQRWRAAALGLSRVTKLAYNTYYAFM